MNYINHFTGFYELILQDSRLNPTHISLYLALFQFWNLNRFQNPICITRKEMMKLSKISAFGTYHKCIRELQEFGYIEYLPSFNPYRGSQVNLLNFDVISEPKSDSIYNYTASNLPMLYNQIKIDKRNKKTLKYPVKFSNLILNKYFYSTYSRYLNYEHHFYYSYHHFFKKCNGVALKEKEICHSPQKILNEGDTLSVPPIIEDVFLYFEEKDAPRYDAQMFFNYYESIGWLIRGEYKMKNWKAAARNWISKSKKNV